MNWIHHFLFIVLTLNGVHNEDTSLTPKDYVYNSNVDVWYSFHSIKFKWFDAKVVCEEENAKLAMPRNIEEVYAIKELMDANGFNDSVFLDANNRFEADEFISRDYHIQYFYHTWYPGRPFGYDKYCAVMVYSHVELLMDFDCYRNFSFVCQRDNHIIETTTVISDDPTYVYEPNTKKYIKLHMELRFWYQARSICKAEGGRLAIIESKQQEDLMVKLFNDPNNLWPRGKSVAFVGFHDQYALYEFYTVSEQRLANVGYLHWTTGEPSGDYTQNCGCMAKDGGYSKCLCLAKSQFFCERK